MPSADDLVPPGQVGPHQIHGSTRVLMGVLCMLYSFSLILVILRFVAKRTGKATYGLEDWTSLAAFVCLTAYFIETLWITTSCYAGWHVSQLYLWQIEKFLRGVYGNNICYAVTLSMVKLSILATYRRLFSISDKFQRVSIVVAGIVLGWMISVTLTQIFTCNPIAGAWLQLITKKCIDQTAFYYGNAISNLLTDVILLILPMPMIWGLNMSTQKKINVTLLMVLGGFVCISSLLRIISFARIDWNDITYTLVSVAQWTAVETPIAYICSSLPILPLIFKTYFKKPGNTGYTSSQQYGNTSKYRDIESNDKIPLHDIRPST